MQGLLVRDIARAPVGRVQAVLLDPGTQDARWLQIALDADGSTVLVPAVATTEFAPGELLVPYPAEVIAEATHARGEVLASVDATRLMKLYGFGN